MKTKRIDDYSKHDCVFIGKLVVVNYYEDMKCDPRYGQFGDEDEYQIDKMEMVIDLSAENKYKKIIQSEITRCHEMILATHKFFRDSLFRPEVVDRDFGKEIREKRIRNAKKIMKKYIANLRQLRYIENTAV